MAQLQSQRNPKNASTDEEYSLLQAQSSSAEDMLKNTSWPQQDDVFLTSAETTRPTFSSNSFDNSQIFASHYALATAYTRVTKKLAEAEKRNKALQNQDSMKKTFGQPGSKNTFASGSSQNNSNFMSASQSNSNFMTPSFDIEASVNQAWEAYNEKCKECQHLRDDLEQIKLRHQNSDHHSRIQDLREDVLREKAKQDDVVRKLEKTKMEADHLGKKETLAREELEKEREYQQNLIQLAEKKHRELEQKIEDAERAFEAEKNLKNDLLRREKEIQRALEDDFTRREEEYVAKIRTLEEKIIALKEEVSVLLTMQSTSASNRHTNGPVESPGSHFNSSETETDRDARVICSEVDSLRGELNDLKTRAAEQAHILSALLENPKIKHLLHSMCVRETRSGYSSIPESSLSSPNSGESGPVSVPVQCSETSSVKRKKKNSPGVRDIFLAHKRPIVPEDARQVVGSSMPGTPTDLYGAGTYATPRDYGAASGEAAVVLKPREDLIQALSRETSDRTSNITPTRNESFEYKPLFPPVPPVGISRVIHVPKSSSERSYPVPNYPPSNLGEYSANSNNNFRQDNVQATLQATTGLQYSQYYNGNIPTYTRPSSGEHNPVFGRLPPGDDYPGVNSRLSPSHIPPSSAGNDTLVMVPRDPFYADTGDGDVATPTSTKPDYLSARQLDRFLNSDRSSNVHSSPEKNILDMSLSDIYQRPPPSEYATPANRYLSSDEDNDTSFEQTMMNDASPRHPKEFVVPKVVRAPTMGPLTQNKKAFQDSRYASPPLQAHTRPSIRAKSEQPPVSGATTSSRGRRSENRTANRMASPHEYPASNTQSLEELDILGENTLIKACPICSMEFDTRTSEDSRNRHVNMHFSDDENDLLSFD